MSCTKAQGFLAKKKVAVSEETNAKKAPLRGERALEVLEGMDEIYVSKGKSVVHIDLKAARPSRAEMLSLLLGPTGNLRAPTLRVGKTLLVGFNEETYLKVLK
jgi:arsenate reductase-like glutaredoxin family protein